MNELDVLEVGEDDTEERLRAVVLAAYLTGASIRVLSGPTGRVVNTANNMLRHPQVYLSFESGETLVSIHSTDPADLPGHLAAVPPAALPGMWRCMVRSLRARIGGA